MEDFELDIIIGKGPAARSIRLDVPQFTLVGATTRTGLLTAPLRDRFGMWHRLDYYDEDELATIVRRSAGILGVRIDDERRREIAGAPAARRASPTGCCAGCATSPRCATRAHRSRDRLAALALLEVDARGSTSSTAHPAGDRREVRRRAGGPRHARRRARRGARHAEDVYEPYLIKRGFLKRTPRGRVVTAGFGTAG